MDVWFGVSPLGYYSYLDTTGDPWRTTLKVQHVL